MDKINFEEVFPILIFTCTINIRAPYRHSRACTPVTYVYATRDSPTPQSGSLACGQHLDKAAALRSGGHHYQGQTMLISSPGELSKQAAADIPVARCLWGSFEGTHNFYTHRLLSTGLGLNSKEEPWIYRMGLDLNTGSRRYSNLNHTRLQRHKWTLQQHVEEKQSIWMFSSRSQNQIPREGLKYNIWEDFVNEESTTSTCKHQ